MRWAAHDNCAMSFGALPLSLQWHASLRHSVHALRPDAILFNAAAGHQLKACDLAPWSQKAEACDVRHVRGRLLSYLRSLVSLARGVGAVPIFVSTAFQTDRKCNVDLANLHALSLELIEQASPTNRTQGAWCSPVSRDSVTCRYIPCVAP